MSELSKRYRAARAYAELDQKELADALGVDVQTVKRRESGTSDPKRMEQIAVAKICGLPDDFFTAPEPVPGDRAGMLAAIEQVLAKILRASSPDALLAEQVREVEEVADQQDATRPGRAEPRPRAGDRARKAR